MSLRHRFQAAAAAFLSPPKNQASGPAPSAASPFGTGSNGITSNAAFTPRQLHQMRPYDRRLALINSRFLDNNLGISGALNDNSAQYAIGDGIDSYSATGDHAYDLSADRFLHAIFESTDFDIAGEQTMAELQYVVARAMLVDGDCGAAKILSRDSTGAIAGQPQVQLFTSDQIDTSFSANAVGNIATNTIGTTGPQWLDGVQRDPFGKAVKYRVIKGDTRFVYADVFNYWDFPARDFLLVMDRKRIQLSRGIPWSHRAGRTGTTMLNLGALEEAAAHINALFAAIITTPTGETPEALESFIVNQYGPTITGEKPDGTETSKAALNRYVEMMGGAKVPVFPEGTKLEAYQSNRPSTVFSGHMDYLVTMLSLSYGIPPSFIWAIAGKNGPETRMTLSKASWYFNYIMLIVIRRFLKPLRDWVLQYGILTGQVNGGRLPANGADWRLATYHGPRDITIDERYFHKTWLDRLAAGKGTEQEYYSLQGKNAATEARRRIAEIAERKKWCEEMGVQYQGEFTQAAPGTRFSDSAQEPDGDEQDDTTGQSSNADA